MSIWLWSYQSTKYFEHIRDLSTWRIFEKELGVLQREHQVVYEMSEDSRVLWYKIRFYKIWPTKFLKHIRDMRIWKRFEEKLGASQRELHTKDEMRVGCNSRVSWYKIDFDMIWSTKFLEDLRDVRTWRSFKEGLGASRRELHREDEMSDNYNSRVLWYKIGFYRIILHLLPNEYKWVISIGLARNF